MFRVLRIELSDPGARKSNAPSPKPYISGPPNPVEPKLYSPCAGQQRRDRCRGVSRMTGGVQGFLCELYMFVSLISVWFGRGFTVAA